MSHASRDQKKAKARKEKLRQADHERRLQRAGKTFRGDSAVRPRGKRGERAADSPKRRLPRRSFDFTYTLFTTTDGLEIDNMPQVRRRLAMPLIFTGLYAVVSSTGYGFSAHLAIQIFIFAALTLACIWPLRSRQRVLISIEKDLIATRPSFLARQHASESRLSAVEVFDTVPGKGRMVDVVARFKDGTQLDLFSTTADEEQGTQKLLRYLSDPTLAERE